MLQHNKGEWRQTTPPRPHYRHTQPLRVWGSPWPGVGRMWPRKSRRSGLADTWGYTVAVRGGLKSTISAVMLHVAVFEAAMLPRQLLYLQNPDETTVVDILLVFDSDNYLGRYGRFRKLGRKGKPGKYGPPPVEVKPQ